MVLNKLKRISNMSPVEHIFSAEEDVVYCFAVIGDRHENTIYSDLTGCCLVKPFEGMQYRFTAFLNKTNTILMHPIKSR